jgi:hypothetical protein
VLKKILISQFLFVFLGGCGAGIAQSQPLDNLPSYKQIIRAAMRPAKPADPLHDSPAPVVSGPTKYPTPINILPTQYGPYEVSRPIQMEIVGGWTWRVCLKGNNKGSVIYLAVFIKEGDIIEVRTSVGTDRCAHEVYEPLS